MSGARKLLIFGGIALASLGMLYGLHYAVFVEHQTLDQMGGSLATGFVHAANRQMAEAHGAINDYAAVKYDYVRQVDLHSHWIGLGMLMIVLGVVFDSVMFSRQIQFLLALAFSIGAAIFPLGVILQTLTHGASYASALAIAGSVLVIASLALVAVGFARQNA
jgi:hypothetical protein